MMIDTSSKQHNENKILRIHEEEDKAVSLSDLDLQSERVNVLSTRLGREHMQASTPFEADSDDLAWSAKFRARVFP